MTSSRISVILPTLGRKAIVERFIDSLNQQTVLPAELLVVDGSPDSAESEYRKRLHKKVTLVYIQTKASLTHQRNTGIDRAGSEIVVFFDDDIVLEKDYLQTILLAFDKPEYSHLAVVYGRIVNHPVKALSLLSKIHRAGNYLLSKIFFLPHEGSGRFLPSGFPTFISNRSEECLSEYVPGGLTAYRAAVIKKIRFDEHLQSYGYMEDDDIGYRISRLFQILYCPAARCQHLHASMGRITPYEAGKMLMINHHYLFHKNFPQDLHHQLAHWLSLIGYPILQVWNLQGQRLIGSFSGLWLILFHKNPLSVIK